MFTDDPFWKTFTKELTDFLNELLRSIEVDVRLGTQLFGKIRGMIGELIALHIATLDNQRRNLEKLPNRRVWYIFLCDFCAYVCMYVQAVCMYSDKYNDRSRDKTGCKCHIHSVCHNGW